MAVSGGDDGTVRVWDLGPARRRRAAHRPRRPGVRGGGRGGRPPVAVSGGDDGTVRVWDLPTARRWASRSPATTARCRSVAVGRSTGGRWRSAAADDGTVRVWDLGPRRRGRALTGHEARCPSVAVGAVDGRPWSVSGGDDGTVRVWDLRTLAPRGEPLTGHTAGRARSRSGWSTTGRWRSAAAGRHGAGVGPADPRGARRAARPATRRGVSVAVGLVDERPVAVSGGDDGTVRVWDLRPWRALGRAAHRSRGLGRARWRSAGDDGRPVAVSGGGTARCGCGTCGPSAPARRPLSGHERHGQSAVGRLGRRPAGGGQRRRGRHGAGVGSAAPAPLGEPAADRPRLGRGVSRSRSAGRRPAGGGQRRRRRTVRVWDLRTLAPLGEPLTGHAGGVESVAVGRSTTAGGGQRRRRRHRAGVGPADPRAAGRAAYRSRGLGHLGRDRHGRRPASGGQRRRGRTVRVWDLRNSRRFEASQLAGIAQGWVVYVAVGRVGDRPVLGSGGDEGTIRVWDLRSSRQVELVSVSSVTGLAVAGPDQFVVSASAGLVVIRIHRPGFQSLLNLGQ